MSYTNEINFVYDELENSGTMATIIYTTIGSYNATTDSFTSSTTEYASPVLLTDCRRVDWGDTILMGEKTLLVPAKDNPRLDQLGTSVSFTIKVSGRIFIPNQVKAIEPDATAIMYKIKVSG
jgi:hypothetical protein